MQANLVKQLAKLVKVRYVEDITASERVGEGLILPSLRQSSIVANIVHSWAHPKEPICGVLCMLLVRHAVPRRARAGPVEDKGAPRPCQDGGHAAYRHLQSTRCGCVGPQHVHRRVRRLWQGDCLLLLVFESRSLSIIALYSCRDNLRHGCARLSYFQARLLEGFLILMSHKEEKPYKIAKP